MFSDNQNKVTDIFEFKSNASNWSNRSPNNISWQLAVLMIIAYTTDIKIHLVLHNSSPDELSTLWKTTKQQLPRDISSNNKKNNFIIYFYCTEAEKKDVDVPIQQLENSGATVKFIG